MNTDPPDLALCDAICGRSRENHYDTMSDMLLPASTKNTCTKTDLVCVNEQQVATVRASSVWYDSSQSYGPENSCVGHQETESEGGKSHGHKKGVASGVM